MSKAKLMISLFMVISIMVFAPPLPAQGYQVRYTAEFSPDELSFDRLRGYDLVRLKGDDWLAELGKPMLPSQELKIALPSGMAVTSVHVVETKSQTISSDYDIFPAQPPLKIGLSGGNIDFVEPDKKIYTSSQPYPSKLVEFVQQSDLAGQSIAILQLYPLQYVPSQKKLTLYTSITLVIEGEGGYECTHYLSPNISKENRNTYRQMIEDMVQNPEEVEIRTAPKFTAPTALPDGIFDHVIITSSSYASYFQPLVDWHTQKGVKDTVVTTSWIYFNYTGADTQKIRSFIIDANSTWGTIYFLLGGENETVPFAYRSYDEDAASDQYYSDFNDDWIHDVFVGRVTVGSTTEINTFVNKVLKYEKDPPRTDYPLDILLIGMDYDDNTHCEELKEYIDNIYIPSRFNVSKVYDSHGGNHRDSVIHYLNAGQNLVNHADHSYITYMGTGDHNHGWGIGNSDVDALYNNDQMSVIVSTGCHPNHMDANDCIAEHFVIYNPYQAGVAFTGNTRSGLYYQGQPASLSNALEKQWWIGLLSQKKYNLGQTIIYAKHHFNQGDAGEKHCEWTFNLLGEPEMPVWTDEPDSFDVTHPSILPPEISSFSVHVEDATTHVPAESAYVCLWKEGEVYLREYTDGNGDIVFTTSPSTLGSMYVTATKHDYIPYQHEVDVSYYIRGDANADGSIDIADVVYIINYLFSDGLAPEPLDAGDTNCDAVVDIADAVYLINYLFMAGPPPDCS